MPGIVATVTATRGGQTTTTTTVAQPPRPTSETPRPSPPPSTPQAKADAPALAQTNKQIAQEPQQADDAKKKLAEFPNTATPNTTPVLDQTFAGIGNIDLSKLPNWVIPVAILIVLILLFKGGGAGIRVRLGR
jgi:hypothetical protein